MYCSINEAWNNNNTIDSLNKRYNNNINKLSANKFTLENNKKNSIETNKSNYPNSTIHDTNIFENMNNDLKNDTNTEELNTEDIMLNTEEEPKSILKKSTNCEELVNKILDCPTCRNLVIKKLNLINNPLNLLQNNEVKEVAILILIGLIVIIILDLIVKIAK